MNKFLLIVIIGIAACRVLAWPRISDRSRRQECGRAVSSIPGNNLNTREVEQRFNEISAKLPNDRHLRQVFEKVWAAAERGAWRPRSRGHTQEARSHRWKNTGCAPDSLAKEIVDVIAKRRADYNQEFYKASQEFDRALKSETHVRRRRLLSPSSPSSSIVIVMLLGRCWSG